MNPTIKVKRQILSAISTSVRRLVQNGQFNTVNEAVIEQYREETGASRFDTYKAWREKGFQVNQGETAYCIWGSPRSIKVDDSKNDYSYFPLCFLFSDLQVTEIENN